MKFISLLQLVLEHYKKHEKKEGRQGCYQSYSLSHKLAFVLVCRALLFYNLN